MSTQTEEAQNTIETQINHAAPDVAGDVVSAFNEEYEKYYGMYVDQNKLEEFLTEMNRDLENGIRPEEDVRSVRDSEGNFIGVGAIKFQDNRAELGSTIIVPEYRSAENTDGDGVYEELFDSRHEDIEEMIKDEEDPID